MPDRIDRIFLGWSAPALPAAAEWLLDQASGDPGEADLGETRVVVPGARARRLFIGALVDAAEMRGVALTPPLVITPGEIPAALLGPAGKPAPMLMRRLAWVDALRSLGAEMMKPLMPRPLDTDDLPGWSRIAGALERASDELAGEGLRFADVALRLGAGVARLSEPRTSGVAPLSEPCTDWLPADEFDRWLTLARVQDRAEAVLRERGLADDALATCAHVFSKDGALRRPERDLVLLSVPELNGVERAAIERGARGVDALVFAPEALAEHFDALGCVDAEAWAAAPVELEESRVLFANDPNEQADLALVSLAERAVPVEVGDVVIGVADPAALPRLRRKAALASGVTVRSSLGEPIIHTAPGRLLTLLGAYLRASDFDAIETLIRHPDVEAALLARSRRETHAPHEDAPWWLVPLDAIRREHAITDPSAPPTSLREPQAHALRFVTQELAGMLGDLSRGAGESCPPGEWADALGFALRAVYAGRELRPDVEDERRTIEALESVREALADLKGAAPAQSATAWQAISLLEERLGSHTIPEPVRRDAIETLGWLELALDPSPVCIVVGLAESCVPGSVTHDALLPNSLRERLGLRTNRARLARDAFLLTTINASRDAVFIASRTADEGDPRIPSRLLFRCSGTALAQRIRRFTRPEHDTPRRFRLASKLRPGDVDHFAPPLRIGKDYAPPTWMRVTDFGAFLRSPAGWYLERRLRLIEHEAPREMTPMLFGILAHAALESFGRDETARDCVDPAAIHEALSDMLTDAAQRQFGARPTAAVRIQTELLRFRLKLFASAQAARRRAGWRIAQVEWSPPQGDAGASLDVNGEPMGLRGKIDRIDLHDDGRIALIDYKTGAGANDVNRDHRRRDRQWRSVQLPLYRHLVRILEKTGEITLGYAGLPTRETEGDVWSFADWSEADLEDADETARGVVRRICAYAPGDVIEPGDQPPDSGALGFVTRARFDLGGREADDDRALAETES